MKKILLLVLLCVSTLSYGNEVILLSPFPPGGPTDRILRVVSRHLTDNNISNIVEYKPGAGGIIAANSLAKTQSNTLMLPGLSLFTAGYFKNEIQYNINNDFKLVKFIGIEPTVLVVKKSSNVTYKDILENDSYTAATPGIGTTSHIATSIIKNKNKNILIVPMKGENEQFSNILGGHVSWAIVSKFGADTHIENNSLKPIFTWTPDRVYPNIPTAKELGIDDKGFYRAHFLITNKNFNKPLLITIREILSSPAFIKDIKNIGLASTYVNEETFLRSEQDKISAMFREINPND